MTLFKRIFYTSLNLLTCFLLTVEVVLADNPFPTSLSLGNKQWTLKDYKENSFLQIALYKSNDNDQTEAFFIQKIKLPGNKNITPAAFVKNEISQLEKKGYKVTSTLLESSPQEIIIDIHIQSDKSQLEDIQRIILGSDQSLIILHYGVRKGDMSEEARNNWAKALKSISLPLPVGKK